MTATDKRGPLVDDIEAQAAAGFWPDAPAVQVTDQATRSGMKTSTLYVGGGQASHRRHAVRGGPEADRVGDTRAWPLRWRLADDFWLVSHDDATGRPRLGPIGLGLGLAGALLGELVMARSIVIVQGEVHVVSNRPPDDATGHAIVEQMLAESRHDLRTWLAFLGRGADEIVAARLLRAGLVRREPKRRLFTTRLAHLPSDMSLAFWRSARLKQMFAEGRLQPEWQDVVLAGLIYSTGLFRAVLLEDFARGDAHLRRCLVGADQSFREIIGQVATLVGDSVLAVRG